MNPGELAQILAAMGYTIPGPADWGAWASNLGDTIGAQHQAFTETPAARIFYQALMESGRRGGPGRHLYVVSPEGQEYFRRTGGLFPPRAKYSLWQAPRMPWEEPGVAPEWAGWPWQQNQ